MIPRRTFIFFLLAAPVFAQAQKANEPTQEEVAKAFAEHTRVSTLRHSALDAADREKVPHLKEFLVLFPNAIVRYLSFADADFPSLSITTTLHDRYEFNMRIPVTYSEDNQKILGYGSPRCHLLEIESVARRGDVLGGTSGGDLQKHFGEEEWKALVKSKGDFSVLGYELNKDAHVPDFELVTKHLKSLERQIPKPAEQDGGGKRDK